MIKLYLLFLISNCISSLFLELPVKRIGLIFVFKKSLFRLLKICIAKISVGAMYAT